MAAKTRLVNLDAMIPRADFALENGMETTSSDRFHSISVKDFKSDGLLRPILRKPDFQRETNHWSPEQVVSLLQCFVNNDLIPSVIVWKSPTYLFRTITLSRRLPVAKGAKRIVNSRTRIAISLSKTKLSKQARIKATVKDQP